MTASRPLLALVLALAVPACASSGGVPSAPPAEGGAGPDEAAKRKAGEEELLTGQGKAGFYNRVNSLASSWQRANAEPGEAAENEARAIETALAREVWGRIGTVLEDLRTSSNPRWRTAAARGLGFVRDERVRPALEAALGEREPRLLTSALVSLARQADAATDDRAVLPHLRDPDPIVRGNAALCLARVLQSRRQQGIPVLPAERVLEAEADLSVLLFDRGDPIVRGNAAQALGALGSPGAEDALLNLLRDDASFVRVKVAQALAACGTPKSQAPLLDALGREAEPNVGTVLVLALGAVAERRGLVPDYPALGTDAAKWRTFLLR